MDTFLTIIGYLVIVGWLAWYLILLPLFRLWYWMATLGTQEAAKVKRQRQRKVQHTMTLFKDLAIIFGALCIFAGDIWGAYLLVTEGDWIPLAWFITAGFIYGRIGMDYYERRAFNRQHGWS